MEKQDNNPYSQQQMPELIWLDRVSQLMDNSIPIPFTNRKFGLDALIGLIPNVGDLASLGVSMLLVFTIIKNGVSFGVLLKMIWNIIVDAIVGAVPFLGDYFDFGFKANRRNMVLLKSHYAEGGSRMNAWLAGGILLSIVLTVFVVMLYYGFKLIATLGNMIWNLFI